MQRAERHRQRHDRCDRKQRRPVPLHQHLRQQHAQQREDRAYGKVYAAGDNDYADAYAEDAEHADQPRHVLQVGAVKKLRVDRGHDDAEDDEQNEYAKLFFHEGYCLYNKRAAPRSSVWPTARRMMASSLHDSRSRMPVNRPSCMTATRSLTPSTSSISLLIIIMATPSRAKLRIKA